MPSKSPKSSKKGWLHPAILVRFDRETIWSGLNIIKHIFGEVSEVVSWTNKAVGHIYACYVVVGLTLLASEALLWVSLHLFVALKCCQCDSMQWSSFLFVPLTFSFKLDSCPVSAEVWFTVISVLTHTCQWTPKSMGYYRVWVLAELVPGPFFWSFKY